MSLYFAYISTHSHDLALLKGAINIGYQNQLTTAEILQALCHGRPDAIAELEGSDAYPKLRGRLNFFNTRNGVTIEASVSGLPEGGGKCGSSVFALHIHNGSACTGSKEEPFKNAGSHYNPADCPHPEHAGDLPPLFSNDGYAWGAVFTQRFKLSEVIGLPVIIHARPDDFTTQPSGNSGEMIACGLINYI
ncbi:MAG: superoxide dismutase family protein [Papillibacter sp.]|jgi:Cu-Zn family superoxide dismutase|nr:superoxide dismutase family protein [Papillibacter sp.]